MTFRMRRRDCNGIIAARAAAMPQGGRGGESTGTPHGVPAPDNNGDAALPHLRLGFFPDVATSLHCSESSRIAHTSLKNVLPAQPARQRFTRQRRGRRGPHLLLPSPQLMYMTSLYTPNTGVKRAAGRSADALLTSVHVRVATSNVHVWSRMPPVPLRPHTPPQPPP
jgi:hypothetical protein